MTDDRDQIIAQLTAEVHGRDVCIEKLNEALAMAESCLQSATATIQALQAAITAISRKDSE